MDETKLSQSKHCFCLKTDQKTKFHWKLVAKYFRFPKMIQLWHKNQEKIDKAEIRYNMYHIEIGVTCLNDETTVLFTIIVFR